MRLSERSVSKAHRLVREGRVREVTATRTFVVVGDHGRYLVTVGGDRATCDCPAYAAHCSQVEAVLMTMGGKRPDPAPAPTPDVVPTGGAPAGHRLHAWSWKAALAADPPGVTLVRISLGKPRWALARAARCPYIAELAPAGGLFQIEDDAEFARRYRERLDGFGVDRIEQRFREVADEHGGRPLVLLCFERDRADCHRATFADWWHERTGEEVPEFSREGP